MEFFTIGVYNSTEQEFFNKLLENRIDTFCDIRQRRAVRGSKYTFVNSTKLQKRLSELEIKYSHILQLAPTKEIRVLQKQVDLNKGELKSERQALGEIFILEYESKILEYFNIDAFVEGLENINSKRVVLFCIEERHEACHRSIVSNRLEQKYHYKVTHI
jgi:uncharacterized protein (DUF488 family)